MLRLNKQDCDKHEKYRSNKCTRQHPESGCT